MEVLFNEFNLVKELVREVLRILSLVAIQEELDRGIEVGLLPLIRYEVGVPQLLFALSGSPRGLDSELGMLVSIRVVLHILCIKELLIVVAPPC